MASAAQRSPPPFCPCAFPSPLPPPPAGGCHPPLPCSHCHPESRCPPPVWCMRGGASAATPAWPLPPRPPRWKREDPVAWPSPPAPRSRPLAAAAAARSVATMSAAPWRRGGRAAAGGSFPFAGPPSPAFSPFLSTPNRHTTGLPLAQCRRQPRGRHGSAGAMEGGRGRPRHTLVALLRVSPPSLRPSVHISCSPSKLSSSIPWRACRASKLVPPVTARSAAFSHLHDAASSPPTPSAIRPSHRPGPCRGASFIRPRPSLPDGRPPSSALYRSSSLVHKHWIVAVVAAVHRHVSASARVTRLGRATKFPRSSAIDLLTKRTLAPLCEKCSAGSKTRRPDATCFVDPGHAHYSTAAPEWRVPPACSGQRTSPCRQLRGVSATPTSLAALGLRQTERPRSRGMAPVQSSASASPASSEGGGVGHGLHTKRQVTLPSTQSTTILYIYREAASPTFLPSISVPPLAPPCQDPPPPRSPPTPAPPSVPALQLPWQRRGGW